MNAVIYCRVSSKEQVDGTSLESQELACREYAARNHLDVARVFVERGESAKFADRTQLLELLAFCRHRANAVDCLLVWKVDRLARNVGDHFSIKASLLKQNIRVVSVTEPIDAKPEGKLLETILAGFAQFDNDLRAARTVQGMRRKLQEGLFPWRAPLGYRTVTLGDKKTAPDEPNQPAFRLLQGAWSNFSTGRYMKVEILHQLTSQGLRTQAGKPLSKQSLDNIFADPYYAGILRDPWSGAEYPGRHLPMIDRATFEKVQRMLGRSSAAVPHKSVRPEFPLRVFVRCANCKGHLTGSFSRGRSKLYPYYHCFTKACDARGNYPLDRVHSEFLSFLGEISPDSRALERLKHNISRTAEAWTEGNRMLGEKRALEIKRIKDQQRQLIRMKMDQLITDEEFIGQRSILDARLGELEAQQEERAFDADVVIGNVERICAPLMDLGAAWESVAVEFQRRFQLLALPSGYVFGGVGTAQRGRLFSFLAPSGCSKSNLVPPTGQSWNQLANEIEAFAALFRESSMSQGK
ncbi:MAG: recombinase family protein [Terracidiphilus sp.]|jgi:DNA invertase Pin-like site-specific DNA recombinase